jgi:hypothetical protein
MILARKSIVSGHQASVQPVLFETETIGDSLEKNQRAWWPVFAVSIQMENLDQTIKNVRT